MQRAVQADTLRKTIPYTLPWDDMPIDLSFIYENEKPAGRHGFLEVDRFVFEDGTEARFWGTNFNCAQCFPSHEHSEKVANRLAKTGVNIVRFHQMDAEWSTPNIFQFTKGAYTSSTMSLDPESLDRLDYLIYCLKKQGIYVFMDLLTYRRFKEGDGVEAAEKMGDAGRPYSVNSRRLIELQKKFNHDLWTHINHYTRLAYKDDPAIVLADITNESDLYHWKVELEPYRSELEDLYRTWAEDQGIRVGRGTVEFDRSEKQIQEFFMEVTRKYYSELTGHMRQIGVRIPLTGCNMHGDWSRRWGHLASQMHTDYIGCHGYWKGGSQWKNADGKFGNQPMAGCVDNLFSLYAFSRAAGKPFFISEWDDPWPNEWRAESPLAMSAIGSLQGWNSLTIHTYRYTLDENVDMIGKPLTSGAIGGGYHRGGTFDTFNDPAKFGLFYHAALLFRRGDVRTADKTVCVQADGYDTPSGIRALQLTPEKHRTEVVLPGETAHGDMAVSPDAMVIDTASGEVLSDTRELYRNLDRITGWIDTPGTKAVYGFVGKEGELVLTHLKINVKTDFTTVALSTLTDEPISHSTNMLLTAVGRADNTESRYKVLNNGMMQQLSVGHGPIQVEIIEAAIEIETGIENLRVMAINPQGFITGYIPSEYKNGVFRFEIGKEFQSMYYLIQSI
jgi:hypothetical protein